MMTGHPAKNAYRFLKGSLMDALTLSHCEHGFEQARKTKDGYPVCPDCRRAQRRAEEQAIYAAKLKATMDELPLRLDVD